MRPVKIPYSIKEMLTGKYNDIPCQVSSVTLLGACAGYCQRALVGESGMIRTQIGK
jgi:hypothetical protein